MICIDYLSRKRLELMTQGKNLVSNEWTERFWQFSIVLPWNLQDSPINRGHSFLGWHVPGPTFWPLKLMTNSNWEYTQSFIQIEPEVYKNSIYILCNIPEKHLRKVLFSKSSETCVFPNLKDIKRSNIMSGDESYIFQSY